MFVGSQALYEVQLRHVLVLLRQVASLVALESWLAVYDRTEKAIIACVLDWARGTRQFVYDSYRVEYHCVCFGYSTYF